MPESNRFSCGSCIRFWKRHLCSCSSWSYRKMKRSNAKLMRALWAAGCAGFALAPARTSADIASWLSATSGSWAQPVRWSTNPIYPVNGNPPGTNYDVTIGVTGAFYGVTLNSNVSVDSLLLNSSTGTLEVVSNGTLSVTAAPITLAAGTLRVNGGVISGGTINRAGGTVLFTSNTANRLADNALLAGSLTLGSSARARFQSGATFTGDASLGTNAALSFE